MKTTVKWVGETRPFRALRIRVTDAKACPKGVVDGGPSAQAQPPTSGLCGVLRAELIEEREDLDGELLEDAVEVNWIDVATEAQRKGVATRMYEAAAKAACKKFNVPLASDDRLTLPTRQFWEKQADKGRAVEEERGDGSFRLKPCPAPESLAATLPIQEAPFDDWTIVHLVNGAVMGGLQLRRPLVYGLIVAAELVELRLMDRNLLARESAANVAVDLLAGIIGYEIFLRLPIQVP